MANRYDGHHMNTIGLRAIGIARWIQEKENPTRFPDPYDRRIEDERRRNIPTVSDLDFEEGQLRGEKARRLAPFRRWQQEQQVKAT